MANLFVTVWLRTIGGTSRWTLKPAFSIMGLVTSSPADRTPIVLSTAEFERFVEELDRPPQLVPELVRLFRRPSRIPPA